MPDVGVVTARERPDVALVGLGVGYSLLGVAFVFYGQRRQNAIEAAVRRGEWTPLDARVMAALTAAGIMLAVATIAVVLFAGS
jgi:hypothetical protein